MSAMRQSMHAIEARQVSQERVLSVTTAAAARAQKQQQQQHTAPSLHATGAVAAVLDYLCEETQSREGDRLYAASDALPAYLSSCLLEECLRELSLEAGARAAAEQVVPSLTDAAAMMAFDRLVRDEVSMLLLGPPPAPEAEAEAEAEAQG